MSEHGKESASAEGVRSQGSESLVSMSRWPKSYRA